MAARGSRPIVRAAGVALARSPSDGELPHDSDSIFARKLVDHLANPGLWLRLAYGVLLLIVMMVFVQSDLLYNAFVANKVAWGHLEVYEYFSDIGAVKFLHAAMPPLFYLVTAAYLKLLMILNLDAAAHHPKNVYVIVFRARGGLLFSLGLVLLKLPNVIMVAVGVILTRRLAVTAKLDSNVTTLLWIASPALIVTALMQGQNDIFPATISLAALISLASGRVRSGLLLLGLAACFKTYTVLLVPVTALALSNRNLVDAVKSTLLGVLPLALISVPFLGLDYIHQMFQGHDGGTLMSTSYVGRMPVHLWPVLFLTVLFLAWYVSDRHVGVEEVAGLWFLTLTPIMIVGWWLPQWFLWLLPMALVFASRDRVFAWLWVVVNGLVLANDLLNFPANMDGGMLMPIFGEHNHPFVSHYYAYHLFLLYRIVPYWIRDGVYMGIGFVCLALCIRAIQWLFSKGTVLLDHRATVSLPDIATATLAAPLLLLPYVATMFVQRLAG